MKEIINVGSRIKKNFIDGVSMSLDNNGTIVGSGIVGVVVGFKNESVIEGAIAAYTNYVGTAALAGVLNVIINEFDNLKHK